MNFIAMHYAQSKHLPHRMRLRYIELMVEKHEASGRTIGVSPEVPTDPQSQRPVNPRDVMKAKAKPMAAQRSQMPPVHITHLPDMEEPIGS